MFGSFLLDQGVEMELKVDMREVLEALDKEVPNFTCQGFGFRITATKGILGSQWRLLVNPVELQTSTAFDSPIGFIIVSQLDDGTTSFQIPPRSEWSTPEAQEFDHQGRYFTSFILQLLNSFRKRGFVDLPGPLPTE